MGKHTPANVSGEPNDRNVEKDIGGSRTIPADNIINADGTLDEVL